MSTKTRLTVGQSMTALNDYIECFKDNTERDGIDFESIVYAVNHDLQVRDYLVGLPTTLADFAESTGADVLVASGACVSELLDHATGTDCNPFHAILAAFSYEFGDTKGAIESLDLVEGKYKLAGLVRRVITAEFPRTTFSAMRDDLYAGILLTLEETAGEPLEDDRPE